MNRPGQPPQRPPSLAPTPGLGAPFRGGPYPSYGLPPRNVSVLQAAAGAYVPGLQQQPTSQRTSQQSQGMVPQSTPTPGFLQRNQNVFTYSAGTGTGAGALSGQQHQSGLQSQPPPPSQQQPNGSALSNSNSLSSHLTPSSTTGNSGAPPSVSSTSEVGLDPNDFPALGSVPVAASNTNSNITNGSAVQGTSYATHAGTGVPLGAGSASGGGNGVGGGAVVGTGSSTSVTSGPTNPTSQTRDFTPDDFPALGGNHHPQAQPPSQDHHQHHPTHHHSHPPGLNGFPHNNEHRQNLLGSLAGASTPGMLHIGAQQTRHVHPGFGQASSEVDKLQQRNNYAIKLNQATHPAWSSPNPTQQPQSQTVLPPSNPFGTTSTSTATATQNGAHPSTTTNPPPGSQQQQLPAPPGVAPPPPQPPQPPTGAVSSNAYVQSQVQVPGGQLHPPPLPNAYAANGDAAPSPAHPATATATATHPQTPAQQVLISAADRWGLLGLLAVIKGAGREVDGGLSSVGTDLGTMGLDMSFQGSLYPTFITPWADQSAAHTVEPDFHLPACYNVQPPPPGPNKAAAFSDETLFFMFYSHPRDALQEVAAQELWNRNWRYHKERRLWITKETGTTPSQKVAGGEQGSYTIWDAENWAKERKEMAVLYADLEEKNHPVFAGAGLVLAQQQGMQGAATTAAGGQTQQQQQVQQAQQQQQQQVHAQGLAPQGQVQQGQRVAFPMSMGL